MPGMKSRRPYLDWDMLSTSPEEVLAYREQAETEEELKCEIEAAEERGERKGIIQSIIRYLEIHYPKADHAYVKRELLQYETVTKAKNAQTDIYQAQSWQEIEETTLGE
ncbi:hypothetical protein [Texcoconibacillus texcoconensis]|uniref:Uncharacterized protein n=1 Tax=Texcoconibacillus texcoconensis TaxID=1095777 RepID=A0A840QQX7_9BACI|nr:hypothetical protein [Texcoconibacillus texcoconensis]MBB5173852.1 hypothetical protein [Texcoconibacillus texcoconensis]